MSYFTPIRSGAIISYIAILLNIIAGLLYTPWMIKSIGVSDYGLYALSGAFLSYFLMDFGLGSAIARFTANARARGDEQRVTQIISTATRAYLLIDIVIAVILVITFFFLSNIFSDFSLIEIDKFKKIYCIAGLFSVISFPFLPQNGIIIVYERFVILKTCDMIQKLLIIVLMIIAIILGYGLFALVLVNGFVGLSMSICKYIYICKTTLIRVNFKMFDSLIIRELFKFSVWVFIIGIAQRLIINIVPTILGIFSGTTQIAIFSIALTLEAYTYTFAGALNGLFMPKVTRMSLQKESREEITNLMIRVGRLQLLVVGLIIVGIIVLGKPFILLWMGENFNNSYFVVLCLVVPGIVSLTQEIAHTLLYVEKVLRYRALIYILASLVSVGLGCLFATKYGAIGTAVGVCVALVLCHVIGMNIVYSKVLKLDILRFFKECHISMIIPLILSGIVSLVLQQIYPVLDWSGFVINGILFTVSFTFIMWILAMNESEKRMIKELVVSIIKKII